MKRALLVLWLGLLAGCGGGTPTKRDGGTSDAGTNQADAGTSDGGGTVDAGVVDAGPPPPPERTATGSYTANGVQWEVWTGFGAKLGMTHQLRFATISNVSPRMQINLTVTDTGTTFSCAATSALASAQYIVDGKVAFFTKNTQCDVALTQIPAAAGGTYEGTFSMTADFEPRSVLDAGFPTMTITNGTFRLTRN